MTVPSGGSLLWIVALTSVVELVTCLFRFGFGFQSTRDTAWLAKFTFGIRIHHGYIGLLLILLSTWPRPEWRIWTFRIGAALLLSDIIHHFVVLWLTQGDPEFHLTYPPDDAAGE